MNEKSRIILILSVILTIGAFILSQVFKGLLNNSAYFDNIIYVPAMFAWLLLLWSSKTVFGNSTKRLFIAGGVLLVIGHFCNILVSFINDGRFPIYGYSPEEFNLLDTNFYHFIADRSTALYMLGDLKIFSGHSAGDFMIYFGIFLIITSLLPFLLKRLFFGE